VFAVNHVGLLKLPKRLNLSLTKSLSWAWWSFNKAVQAFTLCQAVDYSIIDSNHVVGKESLSQMKLSQSTDTYSHRIMKVKIKNHVYTAPVQSEYDPEREAQLQERRERSEAFARLKASWPPGTLYEGWVVAEFVRRHYGIPRDGSEWLLRWAPYKPPEVYGADLEVLPGRFEHWGYAWSEADVHAAARKFAGECRQETATLWSHPKCKGRFKLKPVQAAAAPGHLRPNESV